MGDFNLPPGVSVNDIPGNRPEDMREEAFWETLDNRFYEELGDEKANRFFNNKAQDTEFDELLYNYVNIAREMEALESFRAGQDEALMSRYEMESQAIEQGLMTHEHAFVYNKAIREVEEQWKKKD